MPGRVQPKVVEKPWGREIWFAATDRYAGKVIEVRAGHQLSLQYHQRKHETWMLYSGRMEITYGQERFELAPGEAVEVPPGVIHRMKALSDSVLLEVSTPDLDDVVRVEDDYGR